MILQALTRYYDILSSDPESGVAPEGYSSGNVSFALNLSVDGRLLDIFRLFKKVQRGRKEKEVPLRMIVPEIVKRAGVTPLPNFLFDNGTFVLGIASEEKLLKDPLYAINRFKTFSEWNQKLLSRVDCPAARAVIAFLSTHNPQTAQDNPIISKYLPDIFNGNLVFKLDGNPGFVHDDPEIRQIWEAFKADGQADYIGQCLISGEMAPISRLHQGFHIKDASSMGASLVSFNERSYESYNRAKEQGLNSPVSKKAAFAYGTALNYLLSDENLNRKFYIGDTTVVYWAESPDKSYASIFSELFGFDFSTSEGQENEAESLRDKQAELRLREIAERIKQGRAMDTQNLLSGLNPNTRFYVLGLAPNVARIAVRFFYSDPFYKMIEKIMTHYADLKIVKPYANQPDMIPLWQLLEETVSKKSSDKKASPLMAGSIMRAILNGTPYPAALYYAVINRIRADVDDSSKRIEKINYVRAAIIKAYLTRKYRFQNPNSIPEVLCMSLNEQSPNPAYLLGRLFAVLEKAQKDAVNPESTIKDRYFTSACASPSTVFPVLLRLAQHHISKAEYGYTSDKRIEDIMTRLEVDQNPFPIHLSLDEQGIFVLGYYHQRTALYVPKADKTLTEITSPETK